MLGVCSPPASAWAQPGSCAPRVPERRAPAGFVGDGEVPCRRHDTETWDQGQGGLRTAGDGVAGGGGQRQDKPHSPRRLAPRRWGPRSPQAGCSAESTPTSEVLQKAAGVHTRLESRGRSRVGEVKQSSTFSPRNSHGMPVFVVTLGVIVCIPASADKKTTFDLQSRVAISRGLPRKAESQVPGLSPRWAQMGRAPATWGVSPDGTHGAGFCSRQPGTGR